MFESYALHRSIFFHHCLPFLLDSYYSYRAYMDFGFPDIFISREVVYEGCTNLSLFLNSMSFFLGSHHGHYLIMVEIPFWSLYSKICSKQ